MFFYLSDFFLVDLVPALVRGMHQTSFTVHQIPPGMLMFDPHECEVKRKCPDTPKDGKFSKGESLLWLELFPTCTDSGTGVHWKIMAKEFYA